MLKAAIKHSSGEDQVRHRIIPAETVQTWVEKVASLNTEISEILREEKEEKQVLIKYLCKIYINLIDFRSERQRWS